MTDIRHKGTVKTSSTLRNLCPVIIDGVLRVGGRISRAPVSFDCKHPSILPRTHHVTSLIIWHCHLSLAHAGQEHVIAELRQCCWILRARIAVRKSCGVASNAEGSMLAECNKSRLRFLR
jgi:hypothetical protein